MQTITQELADRGVQVAKLAAHLSPKFTVARHVVTAYAELTNAIRHFVRASRS
jgi:hypothetical protein